MVSRSTGPLPPRTTVVPLNYPVPAVKRGASPSAAKPITYAAFPTAWLWGYLFFGGKAIPEEFVKAERDLVYELDRVAPKPGTRVPAPLDDDVVCVWLLQDPNRLKHVGRTVIDPDIRGFFRLEPSGDLDLKKIQSAWNLGEFSVMYFEPSQPVSNYKSMLQGTSMAYFATDAFNSITSRLEYELPKIFRDVLSRAQNFTSECKGEWRELFSTRTHGTLRATEVLSLTMFRGAWKTNNAQLQRRLPYLLATSPIIILETQPSPETWSIRDFRQIYIWFCTAVFLGLSLLADLVRFCYSFVRPHLIAMGRAYTTALIVLSNRVVKIYKVVFNLIMKLSKMAFKQIRRGLVSAVGVIVPLFWALIAITVWIGKILLVQLQRLRRSFRRYDWRDDLDLIKLVIVWIIIGFGGVYLNFLVMSAMKEVGDWVSATASGWDRQPVRYVPSRSFYPRDYSLPTRR